MTADGRPDIEDMNLAVQMGETLLDQARHFPRVLDAGGMGEEALAVVFQSAAGKLLHFVHDGVDHLLFGADLVFQGQAPRPVYVQERADVQERPDRAGGL